MALLVLISLWPHDQCLALVDLPHISEKTNILFLTRVLTKDIQGDPQLNIQGASKLNGMYLVWLYLFKFILIDFKINSTR